MLLTLTPSTTLLQQPKTIIHQHQIFTTISKCKKNKNKKLIILSIPKVKKIQH